MSLDTPPSMRTAEERWAAVKRTQKRMAAPPGGEEIGSLLAQSMDAYWAQREREVEPREQEAPEIFRRAAVLFRQGEFRRDFVCALGPVAMLFIMYNLLQEFRVAPLDWLPWLAVFLAGLLLLGVWLLLMRGGRLLWLRYSLGSLAAGLLLAVGYGFFQVDVTKSSSQMTLYNLQGGLEDLALSSLQSKMDRGIYLTAHGSLAQGDVLTVVTAENSDQQAIYRARAKGLSGVLVAELGPRSGQMRWQSSGEDTLRVALASGQLTDAGRDDWIIRTEGRALKLKIGRRALGLEPEPGECLVFAYNPDPEDCSVLRALRLEDCRSDTTRGGGPGSTSAPNRPAEPPSACLLDQPGRSQPG